MTAPAPMSQPATTPHHHHHQAQNPQKPPFPPHNSPRTWFLASITSPVALGLARLLLLHGDCIVGGATATDLADPRGSQLRAFLEDVKSNYGRDCSPAPGNRMIDRFRLVSLDRQVISQCQASLAVAVSVFGRIDILVVFADNVVIAAVEEAVRVDPSLALIRNAFELNFFANVNMIKAAMPILRRQNTGHIVVVTATSAHIGLPSMGITGASQWALEGYCDSLAYECAPFNIRISMVHPGFETQVLTSRLTAAPSLPAYPPSSNPAGKARLTIDSLLRRLSALPPTLATGRSPWPGWPTSTSVPLGSSPMQIPATASSGNIYTGSSPSQFAIPPDRGDSITSFFPALQPLAAQAIVSEVVYAIAAIGGHDNPPLHHIVGQDATADAKDKEDIMTAELAELSVS